MPYTEKFEYHILLFLHILSHLQGKRKLKNKNCDNGKHL